MADGGLTAGLLVMSAASTGAGLYASGQQRKLDTAKLNAEVQQAKLAGSEQALVAARGFRQALSSQLALASLRAGSGGSMVRQFGAESLGNFLADQRALESRQKFLDVSANLGSSQIKAQRFARDASSIGSLLSSSLDSLNLNK